MIDGAGGGETLPPHPASKARHLLLREKAYGAGRELDATLAPLEEAATFSRHPASKARHLLLGEKAWGWHKIYPTKKRAWKGGFHARFGSDGVSGGAGRGLRSRSRTQPGLTQAGGHAPNRVPRRVSCAGRGPGSGCAAAHARGPGAGCRRHSSNRGSAAGCAGRRLHRP